VVAILPVRIISEYQRIVLFRWGRCVGTRGPGIVFLIPFVDRPVIVDLREAFLEIPSQTAITKDNAPISIDFIIFNKVMDAVDSVVKVQNFAGGAQNVAATTLRSVVGDMSLDDVLSKRDEMNALLQSKLVTEAEGTKQAAVTVAEGEKQAAILTAEGERQAAILRAEGFALALQKIFEVAQTVDEKTMRLQYLDALKTIGSSDSTKFVVPAEFAQFVGLSGDEKVRPA
jgi:regulator of protease activity HflC (stomatin/prohibitin superfamily)